MNTFLTAELRLVKGATAGEFIKRDQPVLFLAWRDQMDLFIEPTIFLAERVVKRSSSTHTWEGYGYDLLSWFQWCQLKGIDWRDATEADREQFADEYAGASQEGTVNRKLTIARRFYEFASEEGWYRRDVGSKMESAQYPSRPIDEDALAHARTSNISAREKDPLLLKTSHSSVIRPLRADELRRLLNHLGPSISEPNGKRSVRDRLICDLGYVSGTRLGDITKLTTLKFLSITVEQGQEFYDFPVIVEGKGKVKRCVSVPGWLVLAIQAYIATDRAASEKRGRQRSAKPITALFLGHADSKSAGKAITRSAVQKMFALACMQTSIIEAIEVEDEVSGESVTKRVPAHSYHDLRHDCAVLTYHIEKALGNSEPWKVVQTKLGHRSLKVTMDTYLAHVSIFGEKQGVTDVRRLLGVRR